MMIDGLVRTVSSTKHFLILEAIQHEFIASMFSNSVIYYYTNQYLFKK